MYPNFLNSLHQQSLKGREVLSLLERDSYVMLYKLLSDG